MPSGASNSPSLRRFLCVLLTVALLGSVAFTASAASSYDLEVSNSVDGPAQTFTVEGQTHHVSSLSYYESGENIEASVTKSSNDDAAYELLLYNSDKQIEKSTRPRSSSGDVTFTTDDLSAGTYVLAVEEDDFSAVQPIVIQGYDVSMDTRSSVTAGESWTATTNLAAYADAPSIHSVEFVVFGEDTEERFQASETNDGSYEASVTAPENAGEYHFGVIVRGPTEVENGEYEPIAVSTPTTLDVQSSGTDESTGEQAPENSEGNVTVTPTTPTETATPTDESVTPTPPDSHPSDTATPTETADQDGPITPADATATAEQPVSEKAGIDDQPGLGVGAVLAAIFASLTLLARRQ